MGCFIIPAAEAVLTTVATKVIESKEKESDIVQVDLGGVDSETIEKITFSRKLKWLSNLLWGGSGLLAFEHLWHGEVAPWFPFLTAADNPASLAEMLHEMSTAGAAMAALVTVVWAGMVVATSALEKEALKAQPVKARREK